jgi:hypothetical protein
MGTHGQNGFAGVGLPGRRPGQNARVRRLVSRPANGLGSRANSLSHNKKKPPDALGIRGLQYGGTDGTRTRDLRRDRPDVLPIKTTCYEHVTHFVTLGTGPYRSLRVTMGDPERGRLPLGRPLSRPHSGEPLFSGPDATFEPIAARSDRWRPIAPGGQRRTTLYARQGWEWQSTPDPPASLAPSRRCPISIWLAYQRSSSTACRGVRPGNTRRTQSLPNRRWTSTSRGRSKCSATSRRTECSVPSRMET